MEVTNWIAQMLALENGVPLTRTTGVVLDATNPVLLRLGEELSRRMAPAGIDLVSLRIDGDCLVARIDESAADEPLCPAAFRRVVADLTYRLTGQALDGRIEDATPARDLVPAA